MPIIKSALKRVRQQKKKTERNRETASHMRSLMKNIMLWTKTGEIKKAEHMFPEAQKAIDMALKKNLIHRHNAARKKANLVKMMNAVGAKTTGIAKKSEVPKTKTPKKDSVKKK